MNAVTFYSYLRSNEFVGDRLDSEEPEYQSINDAGGMTIKTL